MSAPATNAAAAQTTSKFQSFLNHPAGPKYVDPSYHMGKADDLGQSSSGHH